MKKRSGPVLPAAQHNAAKTLFVDRSIGKYPVGALRAAGASVVYLEDIFPGATYDEVWLAEAGRQGWIAVTKDKRIRHKPNQMKAFQESNVVAVVLVSGNMGREEMADLLCRSMNRILRIAGAVVPPAMFTLARDGKLNRKF